MNELQIIFDENGIGREYDDWYDVASDEMTLGQARRAVKDLRKKLAEYLNQEPCEDAISRQAALDAMYALCDTGETLKENTWRDNPHIDAVVETIEELPSVNPRPYPDSISRTDMLDAIGHGTTYTSEDLQRIIKTLPSVNPQTKTGHWVEHNKPYDIDGTYYCYCDNCGGDAHEKTDFCPWCGAKME